MTLRNFRPGSRKIPLAAAALLALLLLGCGGRSPTGPVILWTDRVELAPLVELFNASHSDVKVVLVYQEDPATALEESVGKGGTPKPAHGDFSFGERLPGSGVLPDLVIGPWLRNLEGGAYFQNLDTAPGLKDVKKSGFYPTLLDYCRSPDGLFLLPVSFNLPALVFAAEHQPLMPDQYLLTLEQICEAATAFDGARNTPRFAAMGFAPRWSPGFLYLAARIQGAGHGDYRDQGSVALEGAVSMLRDWSAEVNGGSRAEDDFAAKYLATPPLKRALSGRCLFVATTSDELFSHSPEALAGLDFRWVRSNGSTPLVPIEESLVTAGIDRRSRNTGAAAFLAWLLKEDTQALALERAAASPGGIARFGFIGGFSALRTVTDRAFPSYYPLLMGNIPAQSYLAAPEVLPPGWNGHKAEVVIPYLQRLTETTGGGAREQ